MSRNIIRISEYEKLYYDDAKPFQQRHWEAFRNFHQGKKEGPELFRIINKGIQATNYVGVIQAGNVTIEILPKTDSAATTAANETTSNTTDTNKQRWHSALLQMLGECWLLNIQYAGYASLNLRSNSILDIYLKLFLAEAESLLHEGLAKKYNTQEINRSVLKGQLIFSQQIKNNIHQERFFTRSSNYENDTLLNRILYQTLLLIKRISTGELAEKAGRLLLLFPEVSTAPIAPDNFEQLQFDRRTERYRQAVQIAKMLLRNNRPDITGGKEYVIAILFDMNTLWEEWVYRRLKKEEANFGITVLRQQSTSFWEADHLLKPKSIRPDIVLQKADKTIVLDTKWKLPKNNTPSDDDLKQMFVYNLYWQCNEGILLYPANEATKAISGNYKPVATLGNHQWKCIVITTHIFDVQGKIDTLFATKLLTRILSGSVT